MEQERRSIRVGLAVIAFGVIFRLLGSGIVESAAAFLTRPETVSLMVYLETGRVIRPMPVSPEPAPTQPLPTQAQEALPAFSPLDAGAIALKDNCGYSPDLSALVSAPLAWDLTQEGPAVLIVHTHTSESYSGGGYTGVGDYRTVDEGYNMLAVGDRVAALLEAGGVEVIHDRTYHDYPEYNGSYGRARTTVRDYLKQYPSIRLVLDIHRDAIAAANGKQIGTTVQTPNGTAAQLMLVVGTDAGGLSHGSWRENLSLAAKLQLALEQQAPGICRPISLRTERFNQDLLPGMLLVEVGAAGNTQKEAFAAADTLAQAILRLAKGTAKH